MRRRPQPSSAPAPAQPLEERADDDLVQLAVAGSLPAFNTLVQRHQGWVRGVCIGRVGMAEADDVCQDAFLKAWQKLGSYRRSGKFRAWLGQIARNTCNDLLRQRQRRPSSSLDFLLESGDYHAPADPDRTPAELVLNLELGALLQAALLTVPEDQRLAVIYRDVYGMDYQEIADATGWRPGTVKSRISRGRRALRGYLETHGGVP